jgi:hypothetical protein
VICFDLSGFEGFWNFHLKILTQFLCSVYQFHRTDELPQDKEAQARLPASTSYVGSVMDRYKPERNFRSKYESGDAEEQVQLTLLEYGDKSVHVDLRLAGQAQKKTKKQVGIAEEGEDIDASAQLEDEKKKKIDSLMRGMSAVEGDLSKISGAKVGDILNFQSTELLQVVQVIFLKKRFNFPWN